VWEKIAESFHQADCWVIFALSSFDLLSNHVNHAQGSRAELVIARPALSPGSQVPSFSFFSPAILFLAL